ncbi:MAG TPA: hypothetical protein VFW20_10890 [Candidatus Limnocylindrales bacterium]|nr:hypothetical protein [Candidatus Limnocylindrales bacterium]
MTEKDRTRDTQLSPDEDTSEAAGQGRDSSEWTRNKDAQGRMPAGEPGVGDAGMAVTTHAGAASHGDTEPSGGSTLGRGTDSGSHDQGGDTGDDLASGGYGTGDVTAKGASIGLGGPTSTGGASSMGGSNPGGMEDTGEEDQEPSSGEHVGAGSQANRG